jgi:hypothetical protein
MQIPCDVYPEGPQEEIVCAIAAAFGESVQAIGGAKGEPDRGRPSDTRSRTHIDLAQEYPEIYRQWMEHPTETQFPNGESFVQMQTRVVDAAYQLYARHHGKTIAIVSHGGVNRILLAAALGVSDANIFRIAQRYAARNLVTLIGYYPLVELMNACPLFHQYDSSPLPSECWQRCLLNRSLYCTLLPTPSVSLDGGRLLRTQSRCSQCPAGYRKRSR